MELLLWWAKAFSLHEALFSLSGFPSPAVSPLLELPSLGPAMGWLAVRGAYGTLCLLPVKNQGGANSGVTHAGRPGVPGLGSNAGLMGSRKTLKVHIGHGLRERGS